MQRAARIPESVLAEIRARLPLASVIGRVVQLKRAGRGWSGLCPFHAEKRPSFAVYPTHFHCYGCGAHGDVIGFVMRAESLSFPEAVARCASEAGLDWERAAPRTTPWMRPVPAAVALDPAAERPAARIARAARMWERAAPIAADGPVAAYLAGRHLWPLPDAAHAVLRQAFLPHPETGTALHPVMLARVDAPDGTLAAVHRTYLAPRPGGGVGKLAGVDNAKLALGALGRGAIRLLPCAPRLGLAEGIETALAAHVLSGLPVWSCISANGIEAVELPFDVAEAVIFADRDPPRRRGKDGWRGPDMPEGAGVFFARAAATRLKRQAVTTEIRVPLPPAADYADVLMARMGEAAA